MVSSLVTWASYSLPKNSLHDVFSCSNRAPHLQPTAADIGNPLPQVRYAATQIETGKSARARGAYLRVSFKNTRETAQAINGWKLARALTYLDNVINHKEAVPMRRYAGSTGRTAQGESLLDLQLSFRGGGEAGLSKLGVGDKSGHI